LLTFPRGQVEQAALVRPKGKEAFAAVMEKLCTHDCLLWLYKSVPGYFVYLTKWTDAGLKEWDEVPMGMRIIRVSFDSVNWVLERGALLIPYNHDAFTCMGRLAAFPLWRRVKNAEDLEMGLRDYWQIMAVK
jgi:hypothetical protein